MPPKKGRRTFDPITPMTPPPDPLLGSFSQARIEPATTSWPILQWHGGLAALAGEGSVKAAGGFFIEEDRIVELGLDPADPVYGFGGTTLRLGGKQIAGWGAAALHLVFLFTDFCWEDRETGRERYLPEEYNRRKQEAPGTERELRGRTRALVAVQELMAAGVAEPVLVSMRGSYSAALNRILRDAKRMADEASKLRRRAGLPGGVPREAFWIEVYRGEMEQVGEGANSSIVALPKADVPADLPRDFLVQRLVEEERRRAGGTFDAWAALHRDAWEAQACGHELDRQDEALEEATPALEAKATPAYMPDPLRRELLRLARDAFWDRDAHEALDELFQRQLGHGLAEATTAEGERARTYLERLIAREDSETRGGGK